MAEEELNKDRLALALEAAGLDLWENDLVTGEVPRKASKTFAELGYSEEEALACIDGQFAFVHPEDIPLVKAAINEHLTGVTPEYRCEFRLKAKDGSWVWYANYGKIIQSSNYKHGRRFIGVTFNINNRKCQENELRLVNLKLSEQNKMLERLNNTLRESEDKFRTTFDFNPDAVTISRLHDGCYVDINRGFTQITGFRRDEVIGKTVLELNLWRDPADRSILVQGLREKGFYQNLETQFRLKDGSIITALISARLISLKGVPHFLSVTRDITELKKFEYEKLKVEKLESLGVLAGGIAHDFNNILTGIMGNISFAKVFLDTTHKSSKLLAEAERAAVRAGELAHQLLTFARGGQPIKHVVSLKHLIDETLSFTLRGSNVKGIVDIPESIHALEADEGQLTQVFNNIIINATQAMPGGGVLTVSARNEQLNENNAFSLPPGPYLRLTFIDQGCGIPTDDLKKIFDPYFTTKSTGTGMGLSSVHSIVHRHGGYIQAASTVGKGTTFTLHLPSIGKASAHSEEKTSGQPVGEHTGGSILIMDDEEMILNVASSMLAYLGYSVTTCANGEETIDRYKGSMDSGTAFLAVIMDLTIPGGVGGKQAAEQILSQFPNACLIVSSGYSNDPIMSNYRDYGFSGAIAKPYNIQKFKEVLGYAIGNARVGPT
ncbi:MAG: PAS domain S-box protein [Desulfofustis sp.]|nr:PAS domain S-box protein [Desulfofustis sp.]